MPVTIRPSEQPAEQCAFKDRRIHHPSEILACAGHDHKEAACAQVLQSSFSYRDEDGELDHGMSSHAIYNASKHNGLVQSAMLAYNQHHHLVIRPDDVWAAILSQFHLYVTANAETLRHLFVEHEGKEKLVVDMEGNRFTVNYGEMVNLVVNLMHERLVDNKLKEWIMAEFSTTTDNDRIVNAVLMMSTLESYFSYECSILCNLPAVTLLGEKDDWEKILKRSEKLCEYGAETTDWARLLRPVLERFVKSFDDPESTADFWNRIVHYEGGGSGPTYLSGWITAFCYFDKDGLPLCDGQMQDNLDDDDDDDDDIDIDAEQDDYDLYAVINREYVKEDDRKLHLDKVGYHRVDTSDIPPAFGSVDVAINDNGVQVDATMVSGCLAYMARDSQYISSIPGQNTAIQPVSLWWMYENAPGEGSESPEN